MADQENKTNCVDSFTVTFNTISFQCSKLEAIREKDKEVYDRWEIRWSKGDVMNGTINIPPNHARTSIFQIIDGFKI